MIVAIATVTAVLLPSGAYASTPLDPPPVTPAAVSLADFPLCSDVQTLDAVGLGWRATRTGSFESDWAVLTAAPAIPCHTATTYNPLNIYFGYLFTSWNTASRAVVLSSELTATCSLSASGSSPFSVVQGGDGPDSGLTDTGSTLRFYQRGVSRGLDQSNCPYVVSLLLTAKQWNLGTVKISAIWKPSFWLSSSGGWSASESPVDVTFEPRIVCDFVPSGGDIFTLTADAFSKIGPWVGCMLSPVGWDRGGKIPNAWQGSSLGGMQSALLAVMPSSLSCGTVATVPVFGGSVALDTCQANFAPAWVKVGVSWFLMLLCAVAIVRRVLWSIGSS